MSLSNKQFPSISEEDFEKKMTGVPSQVSSQAPKFITFNVADKIRFFETLPSLKKGRRYDIEGNGPVPAPDQDFSNVTPLVRKRG